MPDRVKTQSYILALSTLIFCYFFSVGPTFAERPEVQDWAVKIPAVPSVEQMKAFRYQPFDYQTTFEQVSPGGRHSPVNNQTAVGLPGTVPMGFNYLMRLVYSEFEVNFTVQTDKGEKRPYILPNFKQSSPGGWLPGAFNEWDYDGLHYKVGYVVVPNDPQPIDMCAISLTNTSGQNRKGRLFVTLDAAPTLEVKGDIIEDRGKPLAVMAPVVPVERVARNFGCVDPRAISTSPWHPGPYHTPWHHGRVGWYGQRIEYMLKADSNKPMQIVLGHMTSHHLCDAIDTTVEGTGQTIRLKLPHCMSEKANEGTVVPYLQRFLGSDVDGDGYIKISVRAAQDSTFQRSILNVIYAFDKSVQVSDDEIISGSAQEKTKYFVDVGADYFGEVQRLSSGNDPTVFAQRLKYEPDLAPGETKTYLIKFPAIDRKEPATCSYWPRPYDTKESWKGPLASTGRHPENTSVFGREIPKGTNPDDFATFGPKPRDVWQKQLEAARSMDWKQAMWELTTFWDNFIDQGAKFLVPDKAVENLYKHQIAILSLFVLQWWPHEEYMQMLGPDFYWEYCTRDNSYVHIAWDVAGFHDMARKLMNTTLTPKSKLPTSRYPFGQWDDGSAEYDGAWQTRGSQWDSQGQTLRNITTHYLLTRDKDWLARHYDAIVKGGNWIIRRIKIEEERLGDPIRPGYGLMPLAGQEPPIGSGHSFYVNAYALLGLRRCAMMAQEMNNPQDAARFDKAADSLNERFQTALTQGFVRFNDFVGTISPSPEDGLSTREANRPVSFNTDFGGAMLWPTEAVAPQNPLMTGFYQYQAKRGSTTGGLMEWPYIYTDLGIGHIRRGEPDSAVDLFYCYVANATGTNDWGESMQFDIIFDEFDPPKVGLRGTGDSPHGEACGNYINFLRNLLLHEQGDTLHIAPATARRWLAQPAPVGVENAPSFFGPVTYHLQADPDKVTIRGDVQLDPKRKPKKLLIHVRAPGGRGLKSVKINGKKWDYFYRDTIVVSEPDNHINMEAKYETY